MFERQENGIENIIGRETNYRFIFTCNCSFCKQNKKNIFVAKVIGFISVGLAISQLPFYFAVQIILQYSVIMLKWFKKLLAH